MKVSRTILWHMQCITFHPLAEYPLFHRCHRHHVICMNAASDCDYECISAAQIAPASQAARRELAVAYEDSGIDLLDNGT